MIKIVFVQKRKLPKKRYTEIRAHMVRFKERSSRAKVVVIETGRSMKFDNLATMAASTKRNIENV